MPRTGDTPLARFVHAIVHDVGYAFGAPLLSDDGTTITLPVVRLDLQPPRFGTALEQAASVSAADVGRVDRLRVQNDSGVVLFVPPGTVFEGRGTAPRATTVGYLLEPSKVREIEVKCVQASRPVRAGESLALAAEMASDDVTQALLSRDQGRVWATVDAVRPGPAVPPSDGPECGRIVLDAQGVAVAELCAYPETWAAMRRRPSAAATQRNPLGLDVTKVVPVVREFLGRLLSHVFQPACAESWISEDLSVEFTFVDGEVAHLVAFGRDLTEAAATSARIAAAGATFPQTGDALGPEIAALAAEGAEGDVAVAARSVAEGPDDAAPTGIAARPRRRKVLTTGWDGPTFDSLERLSHKEFRGDRSAAIRTLVRQGLRQRGYMGPQPLPYPAASSIVPPADTSVDSAPSSLEERIQDYARIAATETYADWLRKRARVELARLAEGDDAPARDAARIALENLPPEAPGPDLTRAEELEPEEIGEAPPQDVAPPPPVDVRPLLRRAFAASAGGRYPDALTLFDDVLTAEPGNRTALLGRAVALRRSGKAQEALDALDAVLRAEPTNAAALLNRGRVLQERGDLAGALETFDTLARVAPNDWDVWLVRGDVLAKMSRVQEALLAYGEAQRRNPEDEGLKTRIRTVQAAGSASPPVPAQHVPLPRDVAEGQSYLVKEDHPTRSLRVLRALAGRGVPSLVITRQSPDAIRRDVGLTGIRILELSHTPGEGRHDPTALAALGHLVERFVRENRGHGVIALDGLATLVLEDGSRDTLLFVERVHETVLQSHAVFFVSVAPSDLSDREMALLERSLKVLT